MRGHKAAQGLRVFVVYGTNFVRTEIANFFNRLRVVVLIVRSHCKIWLVIESSSAIGWGWRNPWVDLSKSKAKREYLQR